MSIWDYVLCFAFAIYLSALGGMILHAVETEMREWRRRKRLQLRLNALNTPRDGRTFYASHTIPSDFHSAPKGGRKFSTSTTFLKGDKPMR